MFARLCQLLLPVNPLNTHLNRIPQSNINPSTQKPQLTPNLKAQPVIQNSTITHIEEIRVDMADMKVERRPVSLITNVGSCVAICIHDPINKCGGLAHIMLPDSKITKQKPLPSKYADTAVPALTEALRKTGKCSYGLTAKIAGGANMFPKLASGALNIGVKNVDAVKQTLAEMGIKLMSEDVNGTFGRKVTFNISNGTVIVRNGKGEVKEI